eukprot:scaffold118163_cov21-Tisochrysis_lutea.AAC.1
MTLDKDEFGDGLPSDLVDLLCCISMALLQPRNELFLGMSDMRMLHHHGPGDVERGVPIAWNEQFREKAWVLVHVWKELHGHLKAAALAHEGSFFPHA